MYKAFLCGCILLGCYALKSHYASASAEQLRWILAPTTQLVEMLTGTCFEFEAGTGYLSRTRYFIVAPSCSGVNFLITAFLMLSLGWVFTMPTKTRQLLSVAAAAGMAFLTTLIANSFRISVAMALRDYDSAHLHRTEGIVIYFGFLLGLFVLTQKEISPRRLLIPLLVYYAWALGVPLVNGASAQGLPFWKHTLFVLAIPLFMVTILQLSSLSRKYARTFRALKAP